MESLGIPDVGPFKLVQAALAFVIIGGALIAWMRGSNNRSAEKQPQPAVQLYMDGPLQAALGSIKGICDAVSGIYRIMGEIRADMDRNAADDARRKEAELDILRDLRDGRSRPAKRRTK
jgi:hypothetical protein